MKINSALPKGEADGLSSLEAQMLKKLKPVVALVILEPTVIDEDVKTHEKSLKVGIRRIEALIPEDIETATRLVQRAFEARTGDATLPIELENDINEALKGVDTYIPETPQEEVIEIPEGGYSKMTVALLRNLLKKRGLDHSQGTKTELVHRLEANDSDPEASKPKSNVVSIFNDGSAPQPSDDEIDDEGRWNAAAPEPGDPEASDEEYVPVPEDADFDPAEYSDDAEPESDR
ncbi:hypothetical protein SEA_VALENTINIPUFF_107 [Microbacterium phage ValentiniPuff]|uniref:SAP domain-containing protein n=1 Tax=Microbacterium phage ValentiniPuff TaxID=2315705 RepID=A0A386KSC7_9CAUD|nr:hypothetical protein SEA_VALENTINIPUFF_107 [Microbacterium phage ValentiniPuff]